MEKFERKILQFMREQRLLQPGDRLLIACSGGVDSMALLQFFVKLKAHLQIHIAAVHVDHMLRGEQSAGDRAFVEQFCAQNDVPCFSRALDIPAILQAHGGNSQAVCREQRYAYFQEIMAQEQFTKLMTAHHADDQLESMLMGLTKASMTNSLKGMAVSRKFASGYLIRPFLMVTKEEIREYLQQQEVSFREDASNKKNDYTRNRFRHFIVPTLQQENPHVATNAVQLTTQLQQDDEVLMAIAKSKFPHLFQKSEESSYSVKIVPFQSEPLALQRRLILILLNYLYGDSNTFQSYMLVQEILKQFESQQGSAMIHLPEGFIARRQYDEIVFEKHSQKRNFTPIPVELNTWHQFGQWRIYVGSLAHFIPDMNAQATYYYFQLQQFAWPLAIRARQAGDRIRQAGMEQSKKVSRIFIDEKIPSAKRDCWPLLIDAENEVLALLGVRINHMIATLRRPQDDCYIIVEGANE